MFQDIEIEAADGVKLHAWLLYLRKWSPEYIKSRPVVLFFQVRSFVHVQLPLFFKGFRIVLTTVARFSPVGECRQHELPPPLPQGADPGPGLPGIRRQVCIRVLLE